MGLFKPSILLAAMSFVQLTACDQAGQRAASNGQSIRSGSGSAGSSGELAEDKEDPGQYSFGGTMATKSYLGGKVNILQSGGEAFSVDIDSETGAYNFIANAGQTISIIFETPKDSDGKSEKTMMLIEQPTGSEELSILSGDIVLYAIPSGASQLKQAAQPGFDFLETNIADGNAVTEADLIAFILDIASVSAEAHASGFESGDVSRISPAQFEFLEFFGIAELRVTKTCDASGACVADVVLRTTLPMDADTARNAINIELVSLDLVSVDPLSGEVRVRLPLAPGEGISDFSVTVRPEPANPNIPNSTPTVHITPGAGAPGSSGPGGSTTGGGSSGGGGSNTQAFCSDGNLDVSTEQCDDGNRIPGDGCDATCNVESLLVFVTKTTYDGDLGGVSGAYDICEAAAAAGTVFDRSDSYHRSLRNTSWVPFISANNKDAKDSIFLPVDLVMLDSSTTPSTVETIVNDKADLLDSSLDSGIDKDENGDDVTPGNSVITGSTAAGVSEGDDCSDFTSSSGAGPNYQYGTVDSVNAQWAAVNDRGCDETGHIICIEQLLGPDFCGNGILEDDEQCDDGNLVNGDACDENCELEALLIFVSSTTEADGDLGGLAGADKICHDLAFNASPSLTNASVGTLFKAYLSTDAIDASSRSQSSVPFLLPDGTTQVADNGADLNDGDLDAAIEKDESAVDLMGVGVWTGTIAVSAVNDVPGTNEGDNCSNWTDDTASPSGAVGDSDKADSDWADRADAFCNISTQHLYCVQQPSTGCGNQILETSLGEECEDGNNEDGDGCDQDCLLEDLVIFISSATFTGDLGGHSGADAKCRDFAASSDFLDSRRDTTFKALISTSSLDAVTKIVVPAGIIVVSSDAPRTQVAADEDAMFDSPALDASVNDDEHGNAGITATNLMTGTQPDGTASTNTCNNFTSSDGSDRFERGDASATNDAWLDTGDAFCNTDGRLICIEQKN